MKKEGGNKMARHQHTYVAGHIVKRFRWKQFSEIPVKNLTAVVINILPRQKDREILDKWEAHFRQKLPVAGLPESYVITQDPFTGVKVLWKERRAP